MTSRFEGGDPAKSDFKCYKYLKTRDGEEEGVKKTHFLRDVINGWPHTDRERLCDVWLNKATIIQDMAETETNYHDYRKMRHTHFLTIL